MSGLGPRPCVHGRHGEPCPYCELIAAGGQLPAVIDPVAEDELMLRNLLRRLLMDANATWKGAMKERWRGRFDAYLAWYLARRLYGVHGITISPVI